MENIENVIEHSKIELLNQEVSSLSVHIFDVLNQYKNNGVITEEEFVSLRRDPSKFSKFYNQKGINNEQIDDILKSNERRLAAINERRFLRENAEEEMNKEFKIIDEKISEFAKLKVKAQAAMKTAKDKNDFRIYELMARNYDLMMNICYQYKELVTLNHSSLVSDDLYEIANTKMHRGHEYAYEKSFIDDEINAYSSEINDNRISMAVINERMTTDPNKKMKIKKTIDELKRKPAGIVGNKKPDIIVAPNPIKEDEDGNWYVYEEDLFNDLTNQDVKETSKEEKTSEENKTNSSVKSNENSNGVVNTDANKTTIQKENKTVNTESKEEPSNPDVYRQVKDTVRNIYMYKSLLGKGVAGLSDEDIKRYVASYEDTIKELRGENNKNLNNADMQKIYSEIMQEEYVINNLGNKSVNKTIPKTEPIKKEETANTSNYQNNSESSSSSDEKQKETDNKTSSNNTSTSKTSNTDYDLDAAILIAQNKLNELLKEKRAREAKNQAKNETPSNSDSKSSKTNKQGDKPKSKPQTAAKVTPAAKGTNKKDKDIKKYKDSDETPSEEEIKIVDKKTLDEQPLTFKERLRKNWKKIVNIGIATLMLIGGVLVVKWLNKPVGDNEKNKVDDTSQIEETVNPTDNMNGDKAQATPTPSPVQTDENGNYYINEEDLYKNAGEPVVVPAAPDEEKYPSTYDNRPEGDYVDQFDDNTNTNSNTQATAVSNNENKPVNAVSTVATSVNNVNKSFAVDEGTTSSYSSSGGVNSSFATDDNASYANNNSKVSESNPIYDDGTSASDLQSYYKTQMDLNTSLLNGQKPTNYQAAQSSILGEDIEAIRAENGTNQEAVEKTISKAKYVLGADTGTLTDVEKQELDSKLRFANPEDIIRMYVDTITATGYSNTNHEKFTTDLHEWIEEGIVDIKNAPTKTLGRV